MWFPAGSTGRALRQIAKAKTICAGCTVRAQCLDYALDTNQEPGIWGGLTEDERRTLRRHHKHRDAG
jgi:WhiB family transcriptional regulator, redox-sensing transcriptional regulator